MNSDLNIFEISIEWVQEEAKKYINRELTEEELYTTKKCIESGLLFDIDTVFKTAIETAASTYYIG